MSPGGNLPLGLNCLTENYVGRRCRPERNPIEAFTFPLITGRHVARETYPSDKSRDNRDWSLGNMANVVVIISLEKGILEPMPTVSTQSPFTYPNPNPSASPSFTQDDTLDSFIPEPTLSQPAVNYQQAQPNQSVFSQPAVHFQQSQPTQNPNNVQSQQFQQFQTTSISANNAKFPYLEKEKYEIWAMKMEY
ncbi:hypothetical protein Tco_0584200 [Tanacetum coccineum]